MNFAFSDKEFEFEGVTFKRREVSGFSLVELNYASNAKVSGHAHEQANFCMAAVGGCTETYSAQTREYTPFTIGFLPPYHSHSIKASPIGMRAFSIDIAPQWLDRIREYSPKVEDSMYWRSGVLVQLHTKLYYEFQNFDAASPLAVEGLALEMLAEVSRGQSGANERSAPRWIIRARDIVHDRSSLHLSLDTIASEVGVHPTHLARTFRKHFRCSIGEYIRRARIEEACRRMTTSKVSLLEIALSTGFADQSHFTRLFKRLKGTTPAKYRSGLA